MRKRSVWALACGAGALLVWAACGGDEPVDIGPDHWAGGSDNTGGTHQGGSQANSVAGYVSGTRLRATFYQGADGSRMYTGLYDSQLGVDCAFGIASDGHVRCLPISRGAHTVADDFTDPECTVPSVVVEKGCTPPTYVVQAASGGCSDEATSTVFPLGAPSATLYHWSGYVCQDLTSSAGSSYDFFVRGVEVPPSTFVEGEEVIE